MWPTPTPIAIGTPQFALPVDGAQLAQTVASGMIQGWNVFNSQSFSDVIFVIILIIAIIVGMISIRAHLENL